MGTDVAVIDNEQVQAALLDGIELPEVENPEDAARAIVARILASETVEDIFGGANATPAQEVLGRPFEIRNVRWHRSAYEEGPVVFAVSDVTDLESGEVMAVTCGGRNVMAQLLALAQRGAFPISPVAFRRSERATANGFYPLWLEKLPAAAAE